MVFENETLWSMREIYHENTRATPSSGERQEQAVQSSQVLRILVACSIQSSIFLHAFSDSLCPSYCQCLASWSCSTSVSIHLFMVTSLRFRFGSCLSGTESLEDLSWGFATFHQSAPLRNGFQTGGTTHLDSLCADSVLARLQLPKYRFRSWLRLGCRAHSFCLDTCTLCACWPRRLSSEHHHQRHYSHPASTQTRQQPPHRTCRWLRHWPPVHTGSCTSCSWRTFSLIWFDLSTREHGHGHFWKKLGGGKHRRGNQWKLQPGSTSDHVWFLRLCLIFSNRTSLTHIPTSTV